MRRLLSFLSVTALVLQLASCSGADAPSGGGPSGPAASNVNASLNKDDYPVFHDADAGADPAVPAEQGGKGFTGDGWETNTSFDLIGDPRAVKGGMIREVVSDFPTTIRPHGLNAGTTFTSLLRSLVYETLLTMHPTSLEYVPSLATHWQISADKGTYKFRIDPNAKWADGSPVVADDIVASWTLWTDKRLQDPSLSVTYGKFEKPVAESKYIVSVKTKEPNWRNFMYFTGMYVLPAHVIKNVNGDQFLKEFNFKMAPGSGPYSVAEADVDKGNTIKMKRRMDYWGEKQRRNAGLNNFDEIRVMVVRDRETEFEKFKRGDTDFYFVNRAQMWAEQLEFENIKRGLIQKRRIYNHNPNGVQGLAMNTRRPPLDDIRVRKALRMLFNRELLIEKLMYNQYIPQDSIYAGSIYENPQNEKIKYDPEGALKLLAEAGWKDRDAQGRLVKNGIPLQVEVMYAQKESTERLLAPYQEDLAKAGINLRMRLTTFETLVKALDDQNFQLLSIAYTGSLFPNPEDSMLSTMANQKGSGNVTGFKNARVDALLKEYDLAYETKDRVRILQEIDGIFTGEHHWLLEWYAPYQRIAFWNRFGTPRGYISRTGDYRDLFSMWWIDPDKSRALEDALKNPSANLGEGMADDKHWLDFAKTEEEAKGLAK
jgi:microcin C transport system substrate-binding protein